MERNPLPESFCTLPWINLSTDVNGSLRPCCKFTQPNPKNEYQLPNMREDRLDVLWNDKRYQDLRKAFLDGKRPKECQSCWNEEESGIESFRTSFAKLHGIKVDDLEFSPIAEFGPRAMDLKLSNVCNLKCRICGPQASSTYLKELQSRFNITIEDGTYWMSNKILGTENEEIIKNWAKDLVHLEITGGDPMASPENVKILEMIVESGRASEISLLLNTNGTLYNNRLIDLFRFFKKVNVCLSIDDIGGRFEYQRYPASWESVQKNLSRYLDLSLKYPVIELVLVPTVSIFTVYNLPEYDEWARSTGFLIHYNILHYDEFYSIKNLPDHIKHEVANRLELPQFDTIREFLFLPNSDPTLICRFIRETEAMDVHRSASFADTFGEWGRMIMACKEAC